MDHADTEHLSAETEAVPGLTYLPHFLGPERQQALLDVMDQQPWLGDLKRRVQHYGWRYDYKARKVDPALYLGPLPAWAHPLAEQLQAEGWFAEVPDQLIVNEYEPGQGISRHVDCVPCFGPTIASISLGSTCVMELASSQGQKETLFLEPGSLLVLQGEARYDWTHAIPARRSDVVRGKSWPRGRRVSLTYRRVVQS